MIGTFYSVKKMSLFWWRTVLTLFLSYLKQLLYLFADINIATISLNQPIHKISVSGSVYGNAIVSPVAQSKRDHKKKIIITYVNYMGQIINILSSITRSHLLAALVVFFCMTGSLSKC